MEETRSLPAQADFLDLRRTLAELAGGVFTLLCAAALTIYAVLRLSVLILEREQLGLSGLIGGGLGVMVTLLAVIGLWMLYFRGRGETLGAVPLKLMRVMPAVEAVLGVLGCIVMVAALVVILFSNNMVHASLSQASEALADGYFVYSSRALGFLSNLGFKLLIAISILAALLLALLTVRYILLSAFVKQLGKMREKNEPMKGCSGLLALLSYLYGCLFGMLGSSVCRVNLAAGLCICAYGLTLFCEGLLLHKTAAELKFLNTYYAKLNRAVKRRADAIRAQKEALMNAPLAIAASTEDESGLTGSDLPGDDLPGGDEAPDVIIPPAPQEDIDATTEDGAEKPSEDEGTAVNNAQTDEDAPLQNGEVSV